MSRSNISGNVRLGYSEVSDQQPGALGEEFTIIPGEYDAADDVYVNTNASTVIVKLLKNTSGGTLLPGNILKRDATGDMSYAVVKATADAPACAVVDPTLQSAVPINGKFLGIIYGETDVLVGAVDLVKGVTISSNATGGAVVNDLSTVAKVAGACGFIMEAGTAATLAKAFVDFRALK